MKIRKHIVGEAQCHHYCEPFPWQPQRSGQSGAPTVEDRDREFMRIESQKSAVVRDAIARLITMPAESDEVSGVEQPVAPHA